MPQLYQHEILFRAHDAMGHQGISKIVARIQERHTWPGIRRSVGRYVGQCLTCQQVRDKPGDVRFHLKNIQSGYFNELVQYDHLKICPSDNNNTGILVIIDHFSKFAEAVPCSHHDYDAVTTSRLLLQKWFARHGTPTRMQSDNAPNLTADSSEFLKAVKEELCRNTKYTIAARPLPHFTREDETKLAPIQKVTTISPVPVPINVDGVDMKFDAAVVLERHFLQGLYLGRQELRCYNIGAQDAQGEARIDERALLVVAFGTTLQEPIPLYGMIDTGSGVSILSLSAYHALSLLPYDIQLFAANGKTINTIGIAENVNFQLGGHSLSMNFIVIADHLGAEDFLLGRNFLHTYNVLVDLTAMRVTIRDPKTPRHFKPVHEVSDHEPSLVISTEKVVIGPFERKLIRAHVITQNPNEYLFRNVMIHTSGVHNKYSIVSEDTLTSVGPDGTVFLGVRNRTANENLKLQSKSVLGEAAPTTFVFRPIPVDQTD